jgi:hypothetical protein
VNVDYKRQDSRPERALPVGFLRDSFRQTFFSILTTPHSLIRSDMKEVFMQLDVDHCHDKLLSIVDIRGKSPNFPLISLRRESQFLAIAEQCVVVSSKACEVPADTGDFRQKGRIDKFQSAIFIF